MFHELFSKIAMDYKKLANKEERKNYIRLAAWTYRCGCMEFQEIITDSLQKICRAAAGEPVKAA